MARSKESPGQGAARFRWAPVTPDRWPDLEALFGPNGACGGCWCMLWRLPRAGFEKQKGDGNRKALRALVSRGAVPGILGYVGDEPVAWCSVGPRAEFPGLARSRVLAPVDAKPVWSVTCLFVRRGHRRRGLSRRMLRGAATFARLRGARILEGYPVEPRDDRAPDAFVWTGLLPAFTAAGFREVERRSPTRPIVRRALRAKT